MIVTDKQKYLCIDEKRSILRFKKKISTNPLYDDGVVLDNYKLTNMKDGIRVVGMQLQFAFDYYNELKSEDIEHGDTKPGFLGFRPKRCWVLLKKRKPYMISIHGKYTIIESEGDEE